MKRLAYVSDARREMTHGDIKQILEVSNLFNRVSCVTGFLLYRDRSFFQVLEGTPEDLETTYGRICQDWRHDNCHLLMDQSVTERAFIDWDMRHACHADMLRMRDLYRMDVPQIVQAAIAKGVTQHAALQVFLKAVLEQLEMRQAA